MSNSNDNKKPKRSVSVTNGGSPWSLIGAQITPPLTPHSHSPPPPATPPTIVRPNATVIRSPIRGTYVPFGGAGSAFASATGTASPASASAPAATVIPGTASASPYASGGGSAATFPTFSVALAPYSPHASSNLAQRQLNFNRRQKAAIAKNNEGFDMGINPSLSRQEETLRTLGLHHSQRPSRRKGRKSSRKNRKNRSS